MLLEELELMRKLRAQEVL